MSFWAFALLFLVFASKLSLACIGVPPQVSVLIFQHGLHPYMNIILSFLLGLPILFYILIHRKETENLLRSYRTMVLFLLVMLFLETLLQYFFLDNHKGFYSWAALGATYWLIAFFGLFILLVLEPKQVMNFLSTWSVNLVVLSLLVLVVRPDVAFKGGRFIGVFKHIPYMVTCSTVAIVFTLGRFSVERNPLKIVWFVIGIILSFGALLLTGTRSALAAAVMAVVLWVLRAPAKGVATRYFKYSTALVLTVTLVLFGNQMVEYAHDIATGKKALVEREAQDGVESRMEELERGWEYFQTSPWIGQGLLSKFSGKDEVDVNSYNSFKDPHNIFASAGVVGGWPFIVWTVGFLLLLLGLCVRGILGSNPILQIFAIYAITQVPILIIYHWHLSLGGMADRFYWLVFGYLALSYKQEGQTEVE